MTTSQAGGRTPLLSVEKAAEVRARFGTPCYIYDRATLKPQRAMRSRFRPRTASRFAMR